MVGTSAAWASNGRDRGIGRVRDATDVADYRVDCCGVRLASRIPISTASHAPGGSSSFLSGS